MALDFRLLADVPHLAPTLAAWYDAEWPYLFRPGFTALDEAESCARNRDRPDCTVVLLENDEPVAAASLLVDDVLPYPEFSPWLGSVIVRADRRGAGLGTQIVRETMRRAGAMGIRTLHLWTPDHRHFYERLGWSFVQEEMVQAKPVAILRLSLPRNPANSATS
jgi:N-acetylglutamate synthase and related acetyltransferases